MGAEEWVKGYEEGDDDSRVSLLLGIRVDVNREVMDDIDRCIMREKERRGHRYPGNQGE